MEHTFHRISNSVIPMMLVLTIFSKELFTWTVGGVMIDFYGYIFLGVVFLLSLPFLKINRLVLIGYVWLIISSLYMIYFHNIPLFPFLKQAIPISFIYFGTYHILSSYKGNSSLRFLIESSICLCICSGVKPIAKPSFL